MQSRYDIAIVGGGAAGVLAALHALHLAPAGARIALFEPAPRLAGGVAYATHRREHLLNVPAGRMSALPAQPDDFLDWLASRHGDADAPRAALATRYVPRRDYAAYLRERLQKACQRQPGCLQVVTGRVQALQRMGDGWVIEANGGHHPARRVLLATGNAPRPLPARGAGALPPPRLIEAWDYPALEAVGRDASACIVGTGLSMVDVLLTLQARGHRGPVHLLSRHALWPRAHTAAHAVDDGFDVDALHALGTRMRLRRIREQVRQAVARGLPWQAVMERLRPHGAALWRSLGSGEQRRFLRHGARWWDTHRHRVAPAAHAALEELRHSGRVHLHRARLDLVAAGPRCVQLQARTAGGHTLRLEVDHVVNAAGLELRVQAMRNPLLEQLLGEGHVRAGAHGIGLDTDAGGRLLDASGQPQDGLRAIGSLRIGQDWESTAIPELRLQAEAIARDWMAAPRHGPDASQ